MTTFTNTGEEDFVYEYVDDNGDASTLIVCPEGIIHVDPEEAPALHDAAVADASMEEQA